MQGSNLQLLFNRKMFEKELLYVSFSSAVRTGFEPVNSTVTGWHDKPTSPTHHSEEIKLTLTPDYKLTLLLLLEPQEVMFQVKSLALD